MSDEIQTEHLRYEPITGEICLKATDEPLGYFGDGPDRSGLYFAEWLELDRRIREAERSAPAPPTTLAGVLNAVTRDYYKLRDEGATSELAARQAVEKYKNPEVRPWQPMP